MCVIRLDDLPSWFQTRFEGGGSLFLGFPGPTCVLRAGQTECLDEVGSEPVRV